MQDAVLPYLLGDHDKDLYNNILLYVSLEILACQKCEQHYNRKIIEDTNLEKLQNSGLLMASTCKLVRSF